MELKTVTNQVARSLSKRHDCFPIWNQNLDSEICNFYDLKFAQLKISQTGVN